MHYDRLVFMILLALGSCRFGGNQNPGQQGRTSIDFDKGWKFSLGNFASANNPDFDDKDWRILNVPHDWSIEGDYEADNPSGMAGAFLPTGIGWYRKVFSWEPEWQDKKIFIEFDGIYMNSTVWLNGKELGNRPYGYIGFSYELTPYLRKGENVLAVKVDHSKNPSGRWYTGSGIYRHVRLIVKQPIYVDHWGVSLTATLKNDGKGKLAIGTVVKKDIAERPAIKIVHTIFDPSDNQVARLEGLVDLTDSITFNTQLTAIENVKPWSATTPDVYYVKTSIMQDGYLLDEVVNVTGFRSIRISAEKGLLVNGKKTILKGVCNHHDAGPVGTAVPYDVLYRRLKILKDMGCNAIRTSHNPFAPEFYAMCDTMGFYVMDEAFDGWNKPKAKYDYGNYFAQWWKRDLRDFILRDRNHPSVIFWSIGNEVPGFTEDQQKELVDFIKSIDSTRFISQGRGYSGNYIDMAGFNGHGEFKGSLEKFHRDNPKKVLIGTEITHSYQTRGVYRTKTYYRRRDFPAPWERGKKFELMEDKVYKTPDLTNEELFPNIPIQYQSSFDNSYVRMNVRDYWRVTKDLPYFIGAFRWTGFDYLGESFGWPARTVNWGVIDLCGFPTDQYYLYQSIWHEKPMVHLLPHWTHPGKEGVKIPVVAYTNCESAELFLNGNSLGEKTMGKDLQIVWYVPYEPGELKVIAKTNGKVKASKTVNTAGKAAKIKVLSDKRELVSNSSVAHLEVRITDENGNMVPHAGNKVFFDLEGPGKIIGVENGDVLDLEPHKVSYRKAFNGLCLAMVQADGAEGIIKITAQADGLESAIIELRTNNND